MPASRSALVDEQRADVAVHHLHDRVVDRRRAVDRENLPALALEDVGNVTHVSPAARSFYEKRGRRKRATRLTSGVKRRPTPEA